MSVASFAVVSTAAIETVRNASPVTIDVAVADQFVDAVVRSAVGSSGERVAQRHVLCIGKRGQRGEVHLPLNEGGAPVAVFTPAKEVKLTPSTLADQVPVSYPVAVPRVAKERFNPV